MWSFYYATEMTPFDSGNATAVPHANPVQIQCNDEFILSNGTCQPLCNKWKIVSAVLSHGTFALTVMLAIAAGVFGVILLMFAYKRRKKMYEHPSQCIIHMLQPTRR